MGIADAVVSLFVLVFTLTPLIIILLLAFSENWGMSLEWRFTLRWIIEILKYYRFNIINSIMVAAITMLLTMVMGTLIAYGILTKKFKAGLLVDAMVMMPLTISHIVLGLALILAYKSPPLKLHGTTWIVIFGHFIISIPIAFRTMRAMLESLDLSLVEAAMSLGAKELQAVRRVILPIAFPGLIACSLFSFITSLGNYTLTLMVAPERFRTVPLELVEFIQSEVGVFNNFNLAGAMSLFLIGIVYSLNLVIRRVTGVSWQEKLKM